MPDDSNDRTTVWIHRFKDGDREAVQPIWDRYFHRLVGLAKTRMRKLPKKPGDRDEEDVALSAFHSLWQGVEKGRFPKLNDREDLWKLLVFITGNKIYDAGRPGRAATDAGGLLEFNEIVSRDPTPEFLAVVAEEFQRLLGLLADESLRRVALRKMEGYTAEEIAKMEDCARRTVQNKLAAIRLTWEQAGLAPPGNPPPPDIKTCARE